MDNLFVINHFINLLEKDFNCICQHIDIDTKSILIKYPVTFYEPDKEKAQTIFNNYGYNIVFERM